ELRLQLKSIIDAMNFNNLINLSRWSHIKALSDNSSISWEHTWSLFNHHFLAKKSTTTFQHSAKVVFASKMLMYELPLLCNLTKRRPDLYKQSWPCCLCNSAQETWLHLWSCPVLLPRIQALLQETKRAFSVQLRTLNASISRSFWSR